MLGWLVGALKGIGKLTLKGLKAAHDSGVDDRLVTIALDLVGKAAAGPLTDADKRETIVEGLMATGVGEGNARIAVQLALKLFKAGHVA